MKSHILSNKELTITVNEFGAELSSIKDNGTNIEYLWNADPTYWKRHSPILFPIVGSLKNQTYTYYGDNASKETSYSKKSTFSQGSTYSLSQHGFARDMEFALASKTDDEIWFQLEATEETKKLYPFHFLLEIGYRLIGRKITVLWKVTNKDTSMMYFSIGGHPAFMCPLNGEGGQSDYFISFDSKNPIHYLLIDEHGLAVKKSFDEQYTLHTEEGLLSIPSNLFDQDALIIENNQCHKVALVNSEKNPYLTVTFDAPLFGLWSPAKKQAPFICIEPWYGRCDSSNFSGTLEEREWGNRLEAGKTFDVSYDIDIA